MTRRYWPLHERDAAAHMLLTRLAARHPGQPVIAALAEIAYDQCEGPLIRAVADENLTLATRSQAERALEATR